MLQASKLLCVFWVMVFSAAAASAALPEFTSLIEANKGAVVNISTTQKPDRERPQMDIPGIPEDHPFGELFRRFFGQEGPPQGFERESLGSGFVISQDGYVLTNHHVVDGADEIIVRFGDRQELAAELVGSDPRSDLALLKVEAEDLPLVKLGNSDKLRVGEWVLAIGSPFGFEQSATAGIVSAKGRSLPSDNYVPFIQTDVAINPGNSGGPLFNMRGEVVGINSQIYSRTGGYMGLSFAIPIEMAMEVVEQLKDKGRVTRGWLGVLIQEVTRELAESFQMPSPRGALVAKVFPGSPAEEAGLLPGDVIVEYDGREVQSSGGLPPMVGRTPVGSEVPVKVVRAGDSQTIAVTIGELPAEDDLAAAAGPGATPATVLGMRTEDLDEQALAELELEGGVQVTSVEPDSPAALAGIRSGDVLQSIGGTPIGDGKALRDLVADLPPGKSVPVLILRRPAGPVFLALKVPD
jgi:serine protease Do